jgi:BASS family bile acid:Na+ symporter
MEIVTKIAPICLALIMLGLGLGLSIKDFVRILRVPKDFFVGFFSQLVILPIVALGVALILDLPYSNSHRLDDNCCSTRRCYF